MKIESVRIENFRSFKDETIYFDNYTCFVGANGSGKSTVLYALNVFFRQFKDSQTDLTKLYEEDFHHKKINKPIRITVTFTDLSNEAKEDLSHYVRLDKLIVIAVAKFNKVTGTAEVEQHGIRMGFDTFKKYFEREKEKAPADELKEIYANLRKKYPDLPSEKTKPKMAAALQQYEAAHPDKCVPLESSDDFYGVSKGKNQLAPHIQWAFITSALLLTGKITGFRKYGCHIVPVNGKSNLIKPIAMGKLLGIPTYVVFDGDTDKETIPDEEKRRAEVSRHKKENKVILNLQSHANESEWPTSHIIKDNLTCWKTNIGDEVAAEIGDDWAKYKTIAAEYYDSPGGLNKNPLAIAKALEFAEKENKSSRLLIDLSDRIIDFARS